MKQQVVQPAEALRQIGMRWRPTRRETIPVEAALGRYLAAPVDSAPPRGRKANEPERAHRATLNGYALKPDQGAGEHGSLPRVESGGAVPPGADRVLPVEWTELRATSDGRGPRVFIPEDALPAPGYGLRPAGGFCVQAAAGCRIDGRLQASLLAGGIPTVETCTPLRVGILMIGRDLTDLAGAVEASRNEAAEVPAATPDVTGYWLPGAVRALGHLPEPLGIAGNGLEEGREALLRARQKQLRAVIAAGGLGDGIEDRTAELLVRVGARIHFHGVAIRPGRRFLLADWLDVKLLILGGQPWEAAAAFDLFAAPALLSAAGATEEVWNWLHAACPPDRISISGPRSALHERERVDGPTGEPLWSLVPLRPGAESGEGWVAIGAESIDPRLPWTEGQVGWAAIPPEIDGRRDGRFYFCARTGL